MLGPAKPRRLNEPIAVSLEELIPSDHFSRDLEATLDLGFVRSGAAGMELSALPKLPAHVR